MDSPNATQVFITGMRAETRPHDGQLVVSAVVGGGTRVTGPRRLNGRAVQALAQTTGAQWSVAFDAEARRPTLLVSAAAGWVPPQPAQSANATTPVAAVLAWANSLCELTCAGTVVDGRAGGSIVKVNFAAVGLLRGSAVADALALPGVVNVFVAAASFAVYIARDTNICGGLRHLAAQRLLAAPPRRLSSAGKHAKPRPRNRKARKWARR